MTSGGQCVMTAGAALMLLWSASSWDMHTLAVSNIFFNEMQTYFVNCIFCIICVQLVLHTAMPTLVLVPVPSSWMTSSVLQVLVSY